MRARDERQVSLTLHHVSGDDPDEPKRQQGERKHDGGDKGECAHYLLVLRVAVEIKDTSSVSRPRSHVWGACDRDERVDT